jgi:hypothetical protein
MSMLSPFSEAAGGGRSSRNGKRVVDPSGQSKEVCPCPAPTPTDRTPVIQIREVVVG